MRYIFIQFSKLVGFDITPDSGTTLRKTLKNNFTPFLEQMEAISAGASKVSVMDINEGTILGKLLPASFCVFTGVFLGESHAENG